jgi:hypothetical protein
VPKIAESSENEDRKSQRMPMVNVPYYKVPKQTVEEGEESNDQNYQEGKLSSLDQDDACVYVDPIIRVTRGKILTDSCQANGICMTNLHSPDMPSFLRVLSDSSSLTRLESYLYNKSSLPPLNSHYVRGGIQDAAFVSP